MSVYTRSLFLILFALFATSRETAAAGFRIYSTVTITNAANLTNGIQLTVNGSVRTGTNGTNNSLFFTLTNRVDYQRTNLYAHILAAPFTGVTLQYGADTNQIVLVGATNLAMTVTTAGAWASVTNQTNLVYGASPVVLPFGAESNAFKNFIMSAVVDALNNWPTNEVNPLATAFAKFLAANFNTATYSNKSFANGTNYNGVMVLVSGQLINIGASNVALTNVTIVSGTVAGSTFTVSGDGAGTWATIQSLSGTAALGPATLYDRRHNSTNVQSGDVIGHIIFSGYGDSARLAGGRIRAYAMANFTDSNAPTDLTFEVATNNSTTALVKMRVTAAGVIITNGILRVLTQGEFATLIGTNFTATTGTITTLTGSTGTLASLVVQSNMIGTNVQLSSVTLRDFVTNRTTLLNPSALNTQLVGGGNILNRGTNHLLILSSADYPISIDAVTGGFGDGDWFWAINDTPTNITLIDESGFTGTSTDRLRLQDHSVTNMTIPAGGAFLLEWDSTYQRWGVLYPQVITTYQPSSAALSNLTVNLALTNRPWGIIRGTNSQALTLVTNNSLGTFYRWTNGLVVRTNFVASQQTNLITTAAGNYRLQFRSSTTATVTNDTLWAAVFTNSVLAFGISADCRSNSTVGLSASSIEYLPAGAVIDLRFGMGTQTNISLSVSNTALMAEYIFQ